MNNSSVNGVGAGGLNMGSLNMTSIVVSTIVYFIAAYFIKRHLVEMGIPKGMSRGMVVFVGAAAISYGVAYLVGLVVT
jgi:VIT1/CCC1 family predicted Fe2+/Mn2+ transporter